MDSINNQPSDYSPLKWDLFFDQKQLLDIDGDTFNVYRKGTSGPLFYLLHGGGYTGLTWSCFTEELCSQITCQILAPDLRGHGETVTREPDDLSKERQVSDICNIYTSVFGNIEKPPPMVLIGHSMGGALAVHAIHSGKLPNVLVVGVIDVVEGSAMASLNLMQHFLRTRPQKFASFEKAVEWCVKSGTTRNLRSARVSMPSQIVPSSRSEQDVEQETFRWRINLSKTESHWNGWFKGLSQLFLNCQPVKVLILANVDRLDKDLLTGSMRGMFQVEVLPKVGHCVHEDSPDLVANIFAKIVTRYKVIFQKYN